MKVVEAKKSDLTVGDIKNDMIVKGVEAKEALEERGEFLPEVEFISLDIETGGYSKKKNAICEIGFVYADKNLKELNSEGWIIAPYERCKSVQETEGQLCSYKDDAMVIHGITMEEIENGTPAEDVAGFVYEKLTHYSVKVVTHNGKVFDGPRLIDFLERFGFTVQIMIIDTLPMAKELVKDVENYKLPTLLKYFGIENKEEHRAVGDAGATLQLFGKLLEIKNKK